MIKGCQIEKEVDLFCHPGGQNQNCCVETTGKSIKDKHLEEFPDGKSYKSV